MKHTKHDLKVQMASQVKTQTEDATAETYLDHYHSPTFA